MEDAASLVAENMEALKRLGADPEPLARQCRALAAVPTDELDDALRAFRVAADASPSVWDSDYGALLLEALADETPDPARKAALYEAAHLRAGIFTSAASAGGEALARRLDMDRIGRKLEAMRRDG